MAHEGIYVGAYAAAPRGAPDAEHIEARLAADLVEHSEVGGLEAPFRAGRVSCPEVIRAMASGWRVVVTMLPAISPFFRQDIEFGLASTVESGRLRALTMADEAAAAVRRLNDELGRRAVRAVVFHSAPPLGETAERLDARTDALARSLDALASMNWDGGDIWLEHCDAGGHPGSHEKGFLPLEAEIFAMTRVGSPQLGLSLNWGRSAIEGRSSETPLTHIQHAREAGLLRGFFFSGASGAASEYGVWRDSHMPHGSGRDQGPCEAASLMNESEIERAMRALADAGDITVGLKYGVRPDATSHGHRLALLRAGLRIVAGHHA